MAKNSVDTLKDRISKEELYEYYMGHTANECMSHFNISSFPILKNLCTYYGISKNEKFESILNRVSREDVYSYYIAENNSYENSMLHFCIKEDSWQRLLKHYNISKEDRIPIIISSITKEDLYYLYIENDMTQLEVASHYGVCEDIIRNLLHKLEIPEKDRSSLTKNGIAKACERAGGKEVFQSNRVSKIAQTNLDRYGTSNYSALDECKEKVKTTNLEKYGVEHYFQTQEVRSKLSKLHKERISSLGTASFIQDNLDESFKPYLYNRAKSIQLLESFENPTPNNLMEFFNCNSNTPIQNWIKRLNLQSYIKHGYSGLENSFKDFIHTLNLNYQQHCRDILGDGREIDFYFPEFKIGVELNGIYWHSDIYQPKNYHFTKSKLAQEKGIRLIHIYENEWNDPLKKPIIESFLKIAFGKVESKIYARNCEIKEISNKEAKIFNEENHLQGHRNAQVTYGLFYNDNLVQLMSFSKTRWNRNLKDGDSWEIIRGCPGSNNIVVGGVSKLFKHFIKENSPNSIFSYCDFNKFDGKGYEAIGMEFVDYTGPDMKWVLYNNKVVDRKPSKHKELKEASIAKIWGAGSKKYLWECRKDS